MKQGFPLQTPEWSRYERVIVFDGVCNFCNAFVNFVLERDKRECFRFGTLQSQPAQQILKKLQLPTEDFETFLYIEKGYIYNKSTAALKILRQLGFPWFLFRVFLVIPRSLRDMVYDFVARHRYQWMGKSDTCRVPSPRERARFI